MKISTQIFLGFFIVVAVAAYFMLEFFLGELKPGIRQSTEDVLVDTANLLAEAVERELLSGNLQGGSFQNAINDYLDRRLNADIWGLKKEVPDLRVYVTDETGLVIFDSKNEAVGDDYSQWRDVHLTLRGEYGARTTAETPGDRLNTIMHVAAPILHEGRLIGVLTVAKPNISVQPFLEIMRRNLKYRSIWLVGAALILGLFLSYWLSRSIRKLEDYAVRVSNGDRAELPKVREKELSTLATAMELMRNKLEGKDYVERYVHTLTHEMKSPLSAIKGASELLLEGLPAEEQQKFLENISTETHRLQHFIERMLELIAVEKRQTLQNIEKIDLGGLLQQLCDEKIATLNAKSISLSKTITSNIFIQGEHFLIRQAINNLLENAVEFTPVAGEISVALNIDEGQAVLKIEDNGPGIPEYAISRVFERFYSLPSTDSGKKSSGLGLGFVKEVAELHHGEISLSNRLSAGAVACLKLPVRQQNT